MDEQTPHPPPHTPGPALGHEPETASIHGLIYFMIGLVALIAFANVVVMLLASAYRPEEAAEREQPVVIQAPAAVANSINHWQNPRQDYARYRTSQLQRLTGYAWLNRDEGIARIPIERAMQALVEGATPVPPTVSPSTEEAAGAPADTANP